MRNKIHRFIFLIILTLAGFSSPDLYAEESQTLKVVATQAFYADLVKQIGGDLVDVKFIASPKFNVHFIQPKPSDIRNLAKADLYVNAGLDLEAWSDALAEAAGKPAFFRGGDRSLDLSAGIPLLEIPTGTLSRSEGDLHIFGNPHFNMNPENSKIMAQTIAAKLSAVDPKNAAIYENNKSVFLTKMDQKIAEWKTLCGHCGGQEILSYHKDIVYFTDFLGLEVRQYLETKPGIPATPKHLQFLETYVKERNIKAIVMPTYYPKDAADQLAGKIGAKVVMLCQNAGELPGTENLFGFFDYNFKQIADALK